MSQSLGGWKRTTSNDVSQSLGGLKSQPTRNSIIVSTLPTTECSDTFCVWAQIGQTTIKFLIDTSSPVSLLSDRIWKASGKLPLQVWTGHKLVGVDGSPLGVLGHIETHVSMSEVKYNTKFIIVKKMSIEGVLGIDYLTKNCCNIDIPNHRLYFSQEEVYVPLLQSTSSKSVVVRLIKTVQIPGRIVKEVLATADIVSLPNTSWLLEQKPLKQ